MRQHHGKIVGPGEWPAIVDPDEAAKARAVLASRATKGERAARSYLLAGFLLCGLCGHKLSAAPVSRKGHYYRRYACPKDRGGCGRCGIGAEPLELQVAADVLARLGGRGLRDAVAANEELTAQAPDALTELEGRSAELAEMFAAGEIGRAEWVTARDAIEARMSAARAEVADDAVSAGVSALVDQATDLGEAWENVWTLDQKRAVIASVVNEITIAGTTRANNKFDPSRIAVDWKV